MDAALVCVQNDGDLTMSAVARAAGLSRVTIHAHFPTREALVAAVVHRAVSTASTMLDDAAIDEGPTRDALARLLRSSWQALSRFRNLHAVASSVLSPAELHRRHEPLLGPLHDLVSRGQAEGDFRTDLPQDWLVATTLTLLHLAAEQVHAGQLSHDEAGDVVTATVLSVFHSSPPNPQPSNPQGD
ncbi:MAG: TetR/AcrR family transcriptional regulator [Pseudonocardiaceae bacterium]